MTNLKGKKSKPKSLFLENLNPSPFVLEKTNYYLSLVLNRAENRTPPTTWRRKRKEKKQSKSYYQKVQLIAP